MKMTDLVEKKPWVGWLAFAATVAAVAFAAVLGSTIVERRHESKAIRQVDPIAAWEPRNDVWGAKYPREYETYAKTADTSFTSEFGGSSMRDLLAEDPRLVVLWAGYAFSREYTQGRGHYYAIEDIRNTLRTGVSQPATCWTCKSTDVPRLMDSLGVANFYRGKWSDLGSQVVNHIGCQDCHDPKTMDLRISRPALAEAFKRQGKDVGKSGHNEMRTLVCAQCHVEYFFDAKDTARPKYLVFPWDSGMGADRMEAFYDANGHVDFEHKLSKAKILKAQHPDYELYAQGIHGRRGVSCADCHMPYRSEGAVKFTDHQIRSPLANISNACLTCHRQSEETLREDVVTRQSRVNERKIAVEDQLVRAHLEAQQAWKDSATPEEMKLPLDKIRRAQWRWDWVAAANGVGFHAPDVAQQTLSQAMELAQEARLAIARVRARHGRTDTVALPDITTKSKAQAFIGLKMDSLLAAKELDRKKHPEWDAEAARRQGAMKPGPAPRKSLY